MDVILANAMTILLGAYHVSNGGVVRMPDTPELMVINEDGYWQHVLVIMDKQGHCEALVSDISEPSNVFMIDDVLAQQLYYKYADDVITFYKLYLSGEDVYISFISDMPSVTYDVYWVDKDNANAHSISHANVSEHEADRLVNKHRLHGWKSYKVAEQSAIPA